MQNNAVDNVGAPPARSTGIHIRESTSTKVLTAQLAMRDSDPGDRVPRSASGAIRYRDTRTANSDRFDRADDSSASPSGTMKEDKQVS